MKREEKNLLSRQRILDAALREFSTKGYGGASLNTVCEENELSKGMIYHYFKDKDELYLLCVGACFDALTAYMAEQAEAFAGTVEQRLSSYFDARLQFFIREPVYLGIFTGAAMSPPAHLLHSVMEKRRPFDELNISILTRLLEGEALRQGLSLSVVVEDFRMYMDFFNTHFQAALGQGPTEQAVLKSHEEICHRQLHNWLYGVMEAQNGRS